MTVAGGLVYVAGDSAVAVLKPGGEPVRRMEFAKAPCCLAVAKRRLIVGLRDRVLLCDLDGKTQAETKRLAKGAALTSLAVAVDGTIFAADGGAVPFGKSAPMARCSTAWPAAREDGSPYPSRSSRSHGLTAVSSWRIRGDTVSSVTMPTAS
ncbi:MAG: hypothetical protein CM1200mP29_04030 [Verrucomicrobiota bacterium]|nr:MAG: hypothetical protein CM1200mP29_04030 [Verrucomicrobiota bacterium]